MFLYCSQSAQCINSATRINKDIFCKDIALSHQRATLTQINKFFAYPYNSLILNAKTGTFDAQLPGKLALFSCQ
jgi:hypothetical protein